MPCFAVGFQQPLRHLLGTSLSAQSVNIPKAAAKTPRSPSYQWISPFSCPPHSMQPTRVKKDLTWQTCLEVQCPQCSQGRMSILRDPGSGRVLWLTESSHLLGVLSSPPTGSGKLELVRGSTKCKIRCTKQQHPGQRTIMKTAVRIHT